MEGRESYRVIARWVYERTGRKISASSLQRMVGEVGKRCKTAWEMSRELKPRWTGILLVDEKMCSIRGAWQWWYVAVDGTGDIVHCQAVEELNVTEATRFLQEVRGLSSRLGKSWNRYRFRHSLDEGSGRGVCRKAASILPETRLMVVGEITWVQSACGAMEMDTTRVARALHSFAGPQGVTGTTRTQTVRARLGENQRIIGALPTTSRVTRTLPVHFIRGK